MNMHTSRLFLPTLLTGLCVATAQEPADPSIPGRVPANSYAENRAKAMAAKWVVAVDVQMIALPQPRAAESIAAFRSGDPKKIEQAWTGLQESLAKNEAKLLGWPHLTLNSGQRGVTESIVEKRYPTAYDIPSETHRDLGPKPPEVNSLVPNVFETRNAGSTLEAEVEVLDDGRRIFISTVPQRVALHGWKSYLGAEPKTGEISSFSQPEFTTAKSTFELTVENGQRVLIGVHLHETDPGMVELHILQVKASPAK